MDDIIIKNVCYTPGPVINFIKKYSSTDILPFPLVKVVTYNNYKKNYQKYHQCIASFYDKYDQKTFKEKYKKLEELIKEDAQKLQKPKYVLLKAFEKFENSGYNSEEELIKLIIREYTKETYYKDLNRWLMSLEKKYYLVISYFAARLMYYLNKYAEKENKFFLKKDRLYRGITCSFSAILSYKRAVNKIIVLSGFNSTSEKKGIAKGFLATKREKIIDYEFSVIFYIDNDYYGDKISNCINVQDISDCKDIEREILFQAFIFYLVEKVNININKKEADIYLKTIKKTHILEEEMKKEKKNN